MKEYKKPLAEVYELRVTENIAAAGVGKAADVKLKWQSKVPVSLYSVLAINDSGAQNPVKSALELEE